MIMIFAFLVAPLACYLSGAVPFGWIAGRLNGIDIREHGSKNPGATNVWRVLGAKWGLPVFALDVLKGTVPTFAAGLLLADGFDADNLMLYHLARVVCAFACVLGHVYTFWLKFQGGKGVATALGVLLGVWPEFTYAGFAALGVWLVFVLLFRYVSLASIAAVTAFPIVYLLMTGSPAWNDQLPLLVFALTAPTLIIVKHRANIGRLIAGTEPKIGRPKPAGSSGVPSAS